MKRKQRIDRTEPYFVHVGFTFATESIKSVSIKRGKIVKLKVKPVVKSRLAKLRKYWKRSLI